MLSGTALPLALLASTLTAVSAGGFGGQHQHGAVRRSPSHHWSRSNLPGRVNSARPRMARRGSSEQPSTLSEGALTAAEGCTKWYHVKAGDSCYSAIATVEGGLSLEDFYAMNPQVNSNCFNLWANFDYCVSRSSGSSSASSSSSTPIKAAPVENKAVVRVPRTSATAKAVAAPTATAEVTDGDDEDCEVDDEDDEQTSTAAPAPTQKVQVAAAAAQTTDDSAAQAAASKSSADAAWAASSKASADAAWASSSKAAAQAAAASTAAAAQTTKVADTSSGNAQSKLSAMGITTFLGKQTGAIASWFRTNSAQDSTNSNSWCYRKYYDDMPLFAPSLKTMLASAGGDPIAAGKKFCGLEAIVSTPDGRSATMFIGDAFDDRWVLTPTSIDVAYGAFHLLFGSTTDNKNDVIQGVTWELTGNRRSDYVFNNGNPV